MLSSYKEASYVAGACGIGVLGIGARGNASAYLKAEKLPRQIQYDNDNQLVTFVSPTMPLATCHMHRTHTPTHTHTHTHVLAFLLAQQAVRSKSMCPAQDITLYA